MKSEENKVNFDLSALSLHELIEVYENINDFIEFLEDKRIRIPEEEKVDN